MNPPESAPVEDAPAVVSPVDPPRMVIEGGPIHPMTGDPRSALAPATHYLHEWVTYTVRCAGAVRIEVGSQSIPAIVDGVFQISFENQIGLSRLVAFDAADRPIATRHVEVVSHKLGDAARSLAFFKAMLADLASEEGALAFMPRAQTSRTVQQVQRPPSLLIQYFFLINNADSISDALHLIERSPHRILDDESEHVSVFDLTDVDADVVMQLVQGGAAFDRRAVPPRLTAAPSGVWFRVPREGFDSAENRFVKAIAGSLADACDDVLGAPWLGSEMDPAVVRRRTTLSQVRHRLREFTRAPMFDEVGPLHRVPAASRVMQRRAGYRDLNLHWQGFLTSREPVWQRMQLAIDLRDIATLYEYWVWFTLCREMQAVYECGRPQMSVVQSGEPGLFQGMKARFPSAGTLTYNAARKAYSGIWLRPDYLWEPEEGAKVAFDAKFRLAWDSSPLDIGEGEAASDPVANVKADDLVKMHAYRDAIPGLRAAVVLYPGHVAQFRTVDKVSLGTITVGDVLLDEVEGVGAIPMSPLGAGNDE